MHQGSVLIVENDSALRHSIASTLGAMGLRFETRQRVKAHLPNYEAGAPKWFCSI